MSKKQIRVLKEIQLKGLKTIKLLLKLSKAVEGNFASLKENTHISLWRHFNYGNLTQMEHLQWLTLKLRLCQH